MPPEPATCSRPMGAPEVAYGNETATNFNITTSSETFWEGWSIIILNFFFGIKNSYVADVKRVHYKMESHFNPTMQYST